MTPTDDSTPPILYHYTDAVGLMGIVTSPSFPGVYAKADVDLTKTIKLQASDVRFMNDRAELSHAGDTFAKRFREIASDTGTPADKSELLIELAQRVESGAILGGPVQVFAVCFSGEDDELSQWRGYAGGTGGYAIGFTKHVLDHFTFALPVGWPPLSTINGEPPSLMKGPQRVQYTKDEARQEADSLIAQLAPGSPTVDMGENFSSLWGTVAAAARFKDAGFKDEKEWRMIWYTAPHQGRTSVPVEFRPGRSGVVPFLSIAVNPPPGLPWIATLEATWGPRPARTIEDLVVGPSPDQAQRVAAAKQLLETNGQDPSVVRASPIPYRG